MVFRRSHSKQFSKTQNTNMSLRQFANTRTGFMSIAIGVAMSSWILGLTFAEDDALIKARRVYVEKEIQRKVTELTADFDKNKPPTTMA